MVELDNDIAMVTGGTAGIGRSVVLGLAAAGARVVFTGIESATGSELASEIGKNGGNARFVDGDLAGRHSWRAIYEKGRSAFGPFSIFVHSASPPRLESQTALEVTEAQWDAMLDTNLRSGFFLAQAIAKEMRANAIRGRMLFMTSLHAWTPRTLPHYSAAKAGQVMVVRELARALGADGIRVNGIAPGAVPGGGFKGDERTLNQRIPMGRVARPDDISASAIALLSDEHFGYVTGQILGVDGGLAQYNWI